MPQPSLRRAAAYALQGALCTLVPIPFLDDLLMRRTRRRLVREVARHHAVALHGNEVATLSQTRAQSFWGCVGFAASLVVRFPLKLLRRLFRTLLFFLAVRDATSAATRLFHESILLELGLEAWPGESPVEISAQTTGPAAPAQRLRAAIDRTWTEVDPRPIRQTVRATLRGSWSLVRSAARGFARTARATVGRARRESEVDVERALPSPLLDRLATELSHEGPYLSDLARRFRRHWPAPGPTTPPTHRADDE